MTPEHPNSELGTPNPEPSFLTPGRFALILAAFLAVTFWRVLFGGEAFFYRDYGFLGYPFAHFHRECFWSGDFFPLWNPYVNCGAPYLAQWNTLCLYPGSLLYLLLPLPWSLGFFCVAHLFLGGMGMRALAERWTGSRFGAAVAGVAFVFSGLVLGCVIYPNYLVALGWMPWVVLATRRAWQAGGRSLVLAALAGAMQMLTGAPEIILLTWGFLAAMALTEVFSVQCSVFSGRAKPSPPPEPSEAKTEHWILNTEYFLLLRRLAAVIALIAGLCAAQLLPFLQLLSLSQRSGDAVNTFWSLPGWGWVNLFFPLFMNFQTEQGVFVMISQAFFPSVYLGLVPLTLALLAVWRVRTPEVKLLGAATLLAVLLAFGDNFILWRWLREVLPLGVVRFPVKALLLAAFTVPLLAAWGMSVLTPIADRLRSGTDPRTDGALASLDRFMSRVKSLSVAAKLELPIGILLLLGSAVLLQAWLWPFSAASRLHGSAAGLTGWLVALLMLAVALLSLLPRRRVWAALLLFALIATAGWRKNPALLATIPAAAFQPGLAADYHESKGALTPRPQLGESRLMLSPLAERALHTRMVPKFYDDFIGQRLAFWGNLNLLDGLPKVNGASTLVTREWNDVDYFLYGTTNRAPANLVDFLGVTHTTKPGELMQWEHRTNAMPLVSAGQRVVHGDDASKINVPNLRRADWNPREAVFITDDAASKLSTRVTATARVRHFHPRAGDLQSPSASNDRHGRRLQTAGTDAGATSIIEIEAEAAAPTVLVLAQNFYPSWRATVNGQPAPVVRANHAFQAIPIPAGKSTVRLDYVDWPFRIGALLSFSTLLGCVVLWRRGRSRPSASQL